MNGKEQAVIDAAVAWQKTKIGKLIGMVENDLLRAVRNYLASQTSQPKPEIEPLKWELKS